MTGTTELPTALIFRSELLPYSQTFITEQVRSMRRHRPVVVGTRMTGDQQLLAGIEIELVGTRSHAVRAPWRPEGPPFDPVDLDRLRARRPALVHAHFGADGFAALPLAAALSVPLVVTFHGQDATRTRTLRQDWRQWGYEQRIPLLARRATHLIAVSDHVRRRLLERGVPEGVVSVQRIGVDTRRFAPPQQPREEGLVVAVGRLVEKKGFAVLAESFEQVANKRPGARLVLLGDGPERDRLASSNAAHAGHLELRGAVDSAEVGDWLRRAAVVAVPSLTAANGETEGLPTVVVEAMATGAAIVASDHAGIPEAVTDGVAGDLVPEGDARALAASLVGLLGDPERRAAYGRAARDRAVREFELADRTAHLEDLYEQIRTARHGGAVR